jgi:flagellar FliJ protein
VTKSKRFTPVVRLAESREQQAARRLGEHKQALHGQEAKLAQLQTYRQDYIQRFLQDGAGGMTVNQMHSYRAFLLKLDQAITQQKTVIQQALNAVQEKQRQWQQERSKKQILQKVVDKYQQQEQKQAEKREQREIDDRVQKLHSRE